jgi:hypothetical protein
MEPVAVLLGMDMNAELMGKGGMILAAAHVVTSGYCSFASIVYSESNLDFASVRKVTFLRPSPAFAVQSPRAFLQSNVRKCHERGAALLYFSTAVTGVLNRRISLASPLTKVCSGTQISLAWLLW